MSQARRKATASSRRARQIAGAAMSAKGAIGHEVMKAATR